MNTNDWLQVIVGGGVLTGAGETLRWFFGGGRGKSRVDNARVVEAMAIELLKPLNDQVGALRHDLTDARQQLGLLQDDMESLLAWSIAVKAILDEHAIPYPPVPKRRAKR